MTRTLRAIRLIAVAMGAIAAAEPRQPTDRWVVNFDDAQCVASRNYGTADNPLILALKPSPLGQVMRVLLIRSGPGRDPEQIPGSIRFGDGNAIPANLLAFGDEDTKQFAHGANLPMATFVAQRNSSSIAIAGGSVNERLAVPKLSSVLSMLDNCTRDLQDVWNIGPQYRSRIKEVARPVRPLGDLFSPRDYPAQAVSERDSGRSTIVLLIDEHGRIGDCSVDGTSGYATLDTMSCFVIKSRARFEPAIGLDGKPVKSSYVQSINWRMRS